MNGNSAMRWLHARASFYGVCIRKGFDFWHFHMPTTIPFVAFLAKWLACIMLKRQLTEALPNSVIDVDIACPFKAHLDGFR